MNPEWFGLHYPSWFDLVSFSERLGLKIIEDETPVAYTIRKTVVLPHDASNLERFWGLSHELAHGIHHPAGARKHARDQQEAKANRWAACALIPEARIQHHQNACLDVFIGALSAHYEDIPFEDCPARRLAARIAGYRLECIPPLGDGL